MDADVSPTFHRRPAVDAVFQLPVGLRLALIEQRCVLALSMFPVLPVGEGVVDGRCKLASRQV